LSLPLALSLALAGGVWLFREKTIAEREGSSAAARRLERYAVQEASDLARASAQAAEEFVRARRDARRAQEDAMRLEVRGIMDAVCRLVSLSLERSRQPNAERREVGSFPSGFDGLRRSLEIMPGQDGGGDAAHAAIQANTPEISALLPSGYALTIVEDHAREMLRLGSVRAGEGFVGAAAVRDLMFADASRSRRWTVKLELTAQDSHPPAGPKDLAEFLDRRLGNVRPDGVEWRGWVISGRDAVVASFPASTADGRAELPFVDGVGQWREFDGERLLRLERAGQPPGVDWDFGVSVAIVPPGMPPEFPDALFVDENWAIALGCLAFFAALGWVWFGVRTSGRKGEAARSKEATVQAGSAAGTGRRVIRDESAQRTIPDVQGVIVADLPGDGKAHIERELRRRRLEEIPSGSLARLQAIHRGKKNGEGSRILDQARSPLLRKLADRVRPPDHPRDRAAAVPGSGTGGESRVQPRGQAGWPPVRD
jgi:hypothetical protein